MRMTRYEELAKDLENRILGKRLVRGERLPSVRELSRWEGVSASTVVEAYARLLEKGLIESRERSGFFVAELVQSEAPKTRSQPKLIHPSDSLEPDTLIRELRHAINEPKIVPLGTATPAPQFYPYRAISRFVSQALREEPWLTSEYQFPPGSASVRQAIAQRYHRLGVDADRDAVVTTSGAIEAITLALRAIANPGDAVLVESPGYFGVHQALRVMGYQVFEAPCDPILGLEPERLEQAIKRAGKRLKAAITVATHHNPLGVSIPEPARKEILQIALKHGVTVIEDDIYGELSYSQPRPRPLKALDRHENVILCGSFSKTAAPGLRVGYAISQKHATTISALRSTLASGVSTLAEEAMGLYLQSGGFDRHLRKVSREYEKLTRRFATEIERYFPDGTRISRPTGGYLLWVQLPADIDARKVQAQTIERKISVAAGSLFSPQGAYQDCIRINCAFPWSTAIERAVREIGKIAVNLL